MAVPLRKDKSEEELTTADLAQGARSAEQRTTDTPGPRPVASERNVAERNLASEATAHADDSTPLFPSNELDGLRTRWKEVQTAFVDEPRKAVEQADGLVAQAMKRLADNVSTEDLRIALQRYRTFFHRLLSI
jgi:hypothetical protein